MLLIGVVATLTAVELDGLARLGQENVLLKILKIIEQAP